MTENDARIGRKIMVDELNTINEYESMAENADDPKVAELVRDIADEEKVHTGEGAAIVAENDPRAKEAMEEGLEEAAEILKATRQATFENGRVVVKKPAEKRKSREELLSTPGYFDNSRWASLSEDMKKRTDPERYERERKKRMSKSVGPSFAEMFADERGRVLEKTGMMTSDQLDRFRTNTASKSDAYTFVAKANTDVVRGIFIENIAKDAKWQHMDQDAKDYVGQKKLQNQEFLRLTDHPMESIGQYREQSGPMIESRTNKPYNTIYGSKYTPLDSDADSDWQSYVFSDMPDSDFNQNTGEIFTIHPDSRVLTIRNRDDYNNFREKYLRGLVNPSEAKDIAQKDYEDAFKDEPFDAKIAHSYLLDAMSGPSYHSASKDYDWIYFPNPRASGVDYGSEIGYGLGNTKEKPSETLDPTRPTVLDANSLIMLNDYLQDGKTPTRILQRPYTPRDERIAQGRLDDSRHDYVPEKDVSLGFMTEGGRDRFTSIPTPTAEKTPLKSKPMKNVSDKNSKGLFAQTKKLNEKAEKEKATQDEGIQHKKQTVRGSFENLNQIQLKPNEKEGYHITADNKPSNYPKAGEDEEARKKREDLINRMRAAYGGGKQ